MKGNQINFTLPIRLRKYWSKFLPQGSKESSKNAAGALFLFMLMPSHIREIACKLSDSQDIEKAMSEFWNKIDDYYDDAAKAKILLDVARAHEEGFRKKKDDSALTSG